MATTAKAFMMTTVIYEMCIGDRMDRPSCSVEERGRTDEWVTDSAASEVGLLASVATISNTARILLGSIIAPYATHVIT